MQRLVSLAVLAVFLFGGPCMAAETVDCSERVFVPSADLPPGNLNPNHWRAHQAVGQGNIPVALRYLEAAVADGAPYAASMLGDYVERGVCVRADARRALALYFKDAARGDEAGMLLAGLLLLNGHAGVTEPAMAGELFRAVTSRFPKPKDEALASIRAVIGPRPVPRELEEAVAWADKLSDRPAEEVVAAARQLAAKSPPEYEAACNLLYSVKTPEGRLELGRLLLDERAGFPEQAGYALRMIYDAAHRGNREAMELLGRALVDRPSLEDRQTGLMWLIAAEEKGAKVIDAIREAESRLPASRVAFAHEQVRHGLLVPPRGQSDWQPNCAASSSSWRAWSFQ